MLNPAERERIAEAVREAELGTVGEIVVVVARQASAYRSAVFLYALVAALLAPWPLIAATELSASRIVLAQTAAAVLAALVVAVPAWRLALVPRFLKRARAHDAAAREFAARGLTRTRARTGVLVYVAAAEHYAEVIADAGIAERVDPAVWRETIEELVAALAAGRAADGLAVAVARIGAILAAHAPPPPDDTDELPNKVILI